VNHCNISENNASNSFYGIILFLSSNNTLTSNTANLNDGFGIRLECSSDNTLTSNNANLNDREGIHLRELSDNNTLTGNTANSNNFLGIHLLISSYNTLTNNIADSNNEFGIFLENSSYCSIENNTANNNTGFEGEEDGPPPSTGILILGSHNTIRQNNASNNFIGIAVLSGGPIEDIVSANNIIEGNTANDNTMESFRGGGLPLCGIMLGGADNNTIINNTVNSNDGSGIFLHSSSNYNTINSNVVNDNDCGISLLSSSNYNNITCNLVQDNMQNGFYLAGGSIGNSINCNNIVRNGDYNLATAGYEWQFENNQSDCVDASDNWWGASDEAEISASIYGENCAPDRGIVTYLPRLGQPASCASAPDEPPAFTTADAVIALRIAAGSRPPDLRWDVSRDGSVTSLDALMILQAATGAIDSL
jgi:parallel beta-helix repeat protein